MLPMPSCASIEALEQFLTGSRPEAEAQQLRAHLAGCGRCQALLGRLSDDPELRRLAAAAAAMPVASPNEPGLAQMLERLRATPFAEASPSDSGTPSGSPPQS